MKEGLKRPRNCPFDCIKTCDVTHSPYCIMLALYNAFKGRLRNGYAFCGLECLACREDPVGQGADGFAARRVRSILAERQNIRGEITVAPLLWKAPPGRLAGGAFHSQPGYGAQRTPGLSFSPVSIRPVPYWGGCSWMRRARSRADAVIAAPDLPEIFTPA